MEETALDQSELYIYCARVHSEGALSAVSLSLVAYRLVMPGCCHVQESREAPNWLVQERGGKEKEREIDTGRGRQPKKMREAEKETRQD